MFRATGKSNRWTAEIDTLKCADRQRLAPETFRLPVEEMRAGTYADKYFVRTRHVLRADRHSPNVLMQVFCKASGILCGVDEAIAILKLASDDWSALTVCALYDGDCVEAFESEMTIEGPYDVFAHLETLYLGVLARRTRIATQTRRVVDAAAPKEVFYFPARHDHYAVQAGDGYAARIAGVAAVSTDVQGAWWGGEGIGTVPHAAIAAYGGDTALAGRKFAEHLPDSVQLVVLVDFENDSVKTALEVARALGPRLYGVRLDTSGTLVDKSVIPALGQFDPRGVNRELVVNVRKALDDAGFESVRIIASGGFGVDKIRAFEAVGVPVDAYGVGSSLVANHGDFDFTADIVLTDGKPSAKVGRIHKPNPRLEEVP
ncbi:MAG: quinolinate phosphoribosyl transferase [Gammaproteobacteria bacterium]|nr:quinolinate phosphoribosyl transferase [Gammaproteobacteria bacterium]